MYFSPFNGFDNIMFSVVPIIVIVGFVLVFCIIIAQLIKGAGQWKRNNESPVLTIDAAVVTKRMNVNRHHHGAGADHMHHSSSTTYYATFEVESGDRMEFEIRDTEYGMLVECDTGKLTFQGTRYLGFERERNNR